MNMGRSSHLKAVSRTPEVAQTALAVKLDFIVEVTERAVLFHRQIPFKTYVSPNGAPAPGNGADPPPANGDDLF